LTPQPVLVVEDDEVMARAIARNLTARGYSVRHAKSVAEALQALSTETPSVLLLDIELPDGSGWDVLRWLRSVDRSDIPVVVTSALRPNPRLVHELGCEAVLEKPFPIESLLRLVEGFAPPSETNKPAPAL
jgi:DNA-binding response OmpR family regulator